MACHASQTAYRQWPNALIRWRGAGDYYGIGRQIEQLRLPLADLVYRPT